MQLSCLVPPSAKTAAHNCMLMNVSLLRKLVGQWPAPPAFGWCQAVAFVVVPRRFGAPDNLKHLGLVSGRTPLAAERTHGPWRPRRRKTSLNGTEATETPYTPARTRSHRHAHTHVDAHKPRCRRSKHPSIASGNSQRPWSLCLCLFVLFPQIYNQIFLAIFCYSHNYLTWCLLSITVLL